MRNPIQWTQLCLLCALLAGCSHRPMRVAAPCATAGARLGDAWQQLRQLLESRECDRDRGLDCEVLRLQIERLSVDCPGNTDVLMANALLAFEDRNLTRAQQLLDQIFASGSVDPDAAVMRARIALEQGNLQYALKFLEQRIRSTGDHAGLREAYASALYFSGQLDRAEIELTAAGELGAPPWRVAYGKGLIEEKRGRFAEAARQYEEALAAKPGWKDAESRLRALSVDRRLLQNRGTN